MLCIRSLAGPSGEPIAGAAAALPALAHVRACLAYRHSEHQQQPYPAAATCAEAGLTVCMTSLTGVLPWAFVLLAQMAA